MFCILKIVEMKNFTIQGLEIFIQLVVIWQVDLAVCTREALVMEH